MIKFSRRLNRELLALTTRQFSDDVNLQGKYGMLRKEPHVGAQQYDPRKIPKLFTEVGLTTNDEMDDLIEELKRLDPSSSKNLLSNVESVSAPAPEGHFRLERKAYQKYLEQCKVGDMSYLRLQNSEEANDFSNVVFFGANYDDFFPIKNLYKAMTLFKPDAVLI